MKRNKLKKNSITTLILAFFLASIFSCSEDDVAAENQELITTKGEANSTSSDENQSEVGSIESLLLIDADTDEVLFPLGESSLMNLSTLPLNLTIQAITSGNIGSVVFEIKTSGYTKVENEAPYALFGDESGDLTGGIIPYAGDGHADKALFVTPYSEKDGQGVAGKTFRIPLNILDEVGSIDSLLLIDTDTDEVVFTLGGANKGSAILSHLSLTTRSPNYTIQAITSGNIGSVVFEMKTSGYTQVENEAPYALFGEESGDLTGGIFPLGQEDLFVTPYSQKNGEGIAGVPLRISLQVFGEVGSIESLLLIDADTDEVLFPLGEYSVSFTRMYLSKLPPNLNLTIKAITSGEVGSVVFKIKATGYTQVENEAPYALFGEESGDLTGGIIPSAVDGHADGSLFVIPYSGKNGKGIAGAPFSLPLTIFDLLVQSE
ncbi:hypothetical protein [Reichenbachiella versicolor]|uniref:hypothetical protein n=1 Tax=Reichenbachiella versicolor TaxID=1821036 RepID=UPI000D6E0F2F|nr:hypothetical protein [Reichenbachiella versicolor]